MNLLVNTLIESADSDGRQEIGRLLFVDVIADSVFLIRIDRNDALPEQRQLSDVEADLNSKKLRILTADPYAHFNNKPEEAIQNQHRRHRDQAWNLIEPIITASNGDAFVPARRGKLIQAALKKTGSTKKHIYCCLRRYWQGGMTINALLPRYHLCGGKGQNKKAGTAKRGKPRKLTQLKNAPPGINIDEKAAKKLKDGYRLFYEKQPQDGGVTKHKAYELTLKKYFLSGYEFCGDTMLPVLPPAWDLPSYKQFTYWAEKNSTPKDSLRRRQGERNYNLKSRALLGDSTQMAFGPGSQFQIDSTIADVWIVSSLDRKRRLGRPVVYLVVDTFSHMIVGFHAGLEAASFFSAGLALENASLDKPIYCEQFGIPIASEEWPCSGLPESILADRGEMEGYSASNLVQSLGIRVANTAPYRADLKGIVERTFRSMNDILIHDLPGAVRKPKERGERDARLDATLTLREFRILMLRAILQLNSRRIEGYRLQRDMITDGVQPRPAALWTWGIINRSGHLRTADPDVIRANMLPGEKATVTGRGIKFRGLYFSCDRAIKEGWFEQARSKKSWRIDVAYDPRTVDKVFLRTSDGRPTEPCDLLPADQRFRGASWPEVEDFFLSQKEVQENSMSNDLQSRANFQSQVEKIVKNAQAESAADNRGLTKVARLRGVDKNREQERCLEYATKAAIDPDSIRNNEESGVNDLKSETYVPPPSDLDMLRQQRDKIWNTDEN